MTSPNDTPARLGHVWPAEWEPHAATWVAWPHNEDTWPGKLHRVVPKFAELVRTIAACEPVHVLAGGPAVYREAAEFVGSIERVKLWDIETNDAWCRDHGPTFLVPPAGERAALIDWQYNAWGGRYPPFDKDNAVPARIAHGQDRRRFAGPIVLEGGAVDGNGQGTLLTTESCLLNPNRNPRRGRDDLERVLRDFLGARHVLWLPRGELAGDDTDGHVDQLARFVDRSTVVASVADDPGDENFAPLRENFEHLQCLADQDGNRLRVIPLPLPAPKFFRGQRLPASYANFYCANGLVAVPAFGDPADDRAAALLQDLFPDRQVRSLPALDIAQGLGTFHCLTQQEPRVPAGVSSNR